MEEAIHKRIEKILKELKTDKSYVDALATLLSDFMDADHVTPSKTLSDSIKQYSIKTGSVSILFLGSNFTTMAYSISK